MKKTKKTQEEIDADLQAYENMAMEQQVSPESELKGVLNAMNEDTLERDTGFASIDKHSRISSYEKSCIAQHDTLVHMDCLPAECLCTTRKSMRLSISLGGEGRREAVRVIQGEREHKQGGGFMDKVKGMFSPKSE